ncbi:MAG: RnfABCDGE type electron transport complex subunit D [Cyclobacteriaceae bacterium]|nr:RnfABCDGE type electron transport complex subunit D [Cyclobacteriaceae bacterium]
MKLADAAIKSKNLPILKRIGEFLSRYMAPLFISLILLVGHLSFGILEGYETIMIAIGTSIIVDLAIGKLYTGKWKNLTSAYISGISVSILIRSTFYWPYALTAAISILSKYVLRYKGRHIWNPSNFGISWMLFTAPLFVAGLSVQWGNNLLPMAVIWMLGMVIVYRAKRFHITITYVISFLVFAYIRSLITQDPFLAEVAPLTGPMYQLFIFFMITDPPTNVRSKKGQMLVAFFVALVEFVLRLNQFVYAPFYALTIVGPIAKYIDLRMTNSKPQF